MPTFVYKARTTDGKLVKGTAESASQNHVLQRLEEKGFYPVEVKASRGPGRVSALLRRKKKIKHDDKILFTRQLESMLSAGISLTVSLQALSEQSEQPELQAALVGIRKDIESGTTLTQALERQPVLYSSMYINMIHAGEESGLLGEMIERVGDLLEYDAETRARIKAAIFYPALVIGELGLAMVVVVRFVFPRFKTLFSSHGAALPLPTQVMIAVSNAAENYGVFFLVAAIVGAFGARWYIRKPRGRLIVDQSLLRAPIFGEITLKILMSRFSRVLSALLQAGIPLVRSLEIVERTLDNVVIKKEIAIMEDGIRKGRGLVEAVEGRGIFPPAVCKMLEIGERTGTLETMLERVSSLYDRQVDYRIKNLTTVIEPIMLVVLGISVLFIALAVFMPMWNLMGAVSGH